MSATRKSERLAEKSQGRQEPKQLPTRRDSVIALDERDIIPDSPSSSSSGPPKQTSAGQASTSPVSDVQSAAPFSASNAPSGFRPPRPKGERTDDHNAAPKTDPASIPRVDLEEHKQWMRNYSALQSLQSTKQEAKRASVVSEPKWSHVDPDKLTNLLAQQSAMHEAWRAAPGSQYEPPRSSDSKST